MSDNTEVEWKERMDAFNTFLESRRVSGANAEYTHTRVSNEPSGKFCIKTGADNAMFLKLYCDVFSHTVPNLTLAEKQQNVGPLMTDYDFEFDAENKERIYDIEVISRVVKILNQIVYETLDIEEDMVKAFVTEKGHPTIEYEDELDEDGNQVIHRVKDGFHICYILPMSSEQRFYIYNKLKERAMSEEIFDDLPITNEYEKILDESTIQRNGWMLYGSIKRLRGKIGQLYRLTHVFDYNMEDEPIEQYKLEDLVYLFSVRQFDEDDVIDIRPEITEDFETFQKLHNRKKEKKEPKQVAEPGKPLTIIQPRIQLAKKLAGILSAKRAESYDEWVRVCWTLKSIGDELYDEFIAFSQKSKKFNLASCNTAWQTTNTYAYTIASLYWWARKDNPAKYEEVIKENLDKVFVRVEEGTPCDIAELVHALYPYQFACVSIRTASWFEFRDHRWKETECGSAIRKIIQNEISCIVLETSARYAQASRGQNNDAVVSNTIKSDKLNKLARRLRDTSMLNNVITECAHKYYIPEFEKKLDSNTKLIGFDNGIYDLETGKFRDGTPDDYVSFSTGYNYKDYVGNEPIFADIETYFCQIQPNQRIRDYLLKICAGYLDGQNRDQKFLIWTGSGCHSPDTEIMMFDGQVKLAKNIKVGDQLMGDDSKPRNVQRLFSGTQDMYKITLQDNTHMTVNANHRLALKSTYDGELYYDVSSKSYVVEYHTRSDTIPIKQYMIFKEDCVVDKKRSEVLAKRYLEDKRNESAMIRKGQIIPITVANYMTIPEEVKKHYVCFRNKLNFEPKQILGDAYKLGFAMTNGRIPSTYVFNTVQIRERLLSGLLDKFGYLIGEHVYMEVANQELINDIIFVCRSLGYHINLVSETTIEIIGKFSHLKCYHLKFVNSVDKIHSLEYTFTVEKQGMGQFYGFGVDKNERYVLQNYIVTYNSNGKSLTTGLLKRAYGRYLCAFDHTVLTRKRGGSSNASPELADKNGVRMGIMQEPEEDDIIFASFLKQLSGEDEICARALYKAGFTFMPQFKLIMICNVLPQIKANDGGTWRRIVVVPFDSEFVDFPPEKPNQFPRDSMMSTKMKEWHIPFMWLLLKKYYPLWIDGNSSPKEVEIKTNTYKNACDVYRDFVQSYCEITKSDHDRIAVDDMFVAFKQWYKDSMNSTLCPIKRVMIENLERSLGLKTENGRVLRVKHRSVKDGEVETM